MELHTSQAPAIVGLDPKSWLYTRREHAAMHAAVRSMRRVGVTLPVIFGGRHLGWVRGDYWSDVVQYRFTTPTLDNIINAATVNGTWLSQPFSKMGNGINVPIGKWCDFYPVGPGGGDYSGTANTARRFTDGTDSGLYHGGNVSPKTKIVTGGFMQGNLIAGVFMLYDRVLSYDNCTYSTSLQSMTNTLTAQRYISAGQPGLQIWATMQNATGGNANLTQLSYNDVGGTTASVPTSFTLAFDGTVVTAAGNTVPAQSALRYNSNANGSVLFLPLAPGDSGVAQVNSYTSSAAITGNFTLTLVYPIALFPTPTSFEAAADSDLLRQVPNSQVIYDGACLNWGLFSSENDAADFYGSVDFVWV